MRLGKISKTAILSAAIILFALALRLFWIGRTDNTGDEIFGVKLAFKISLLFSQYLFMPLILLAVLAAIIYFVGFKKNWKLAALIAAVLVAVKVFTSIPLTLHISNGPVIYFANAFVIFFTGLQAHIAGEFTASLFMILMAIAGYFLVKEYAGKEIALVAFAALLASPLGTFLGSTDFAYGVSDSLMYISLAMLLIGLKKKPELIALSGIAFAISIATRYPPMLMLLFFGIIIFYKRELLLSKEFKPALMCFLLLVGGTTIAYGLEASKTYNLWNTLWVSSPTIGDKPHFSVFLKDIELNSVGADGKISNLIYPLFLNFFYTPAIFAFLAIAVFVAYKKRDKLTGIFLLIIPAFLLVFTMSSYRRPNYLNTVDFAIIIAVILALSHFKKFGKALAVIFAVLLLAQSALLLSQHSFKGFSETIQKIPDNSRVFASFYDGAIYYSGNYLADTNINNAFFSKFFQGVKSNSKERIKVLFEEKDFSTSKADYAVLEADVIAHYSPEKKGFLLCRQEFFNEQEKQPVIFVYASSEEKCRTFNQ